MLTSCSLPLPTPQADPTRFYVLANEPVMREPKTKGPAVHLRPIELAGYLKTKSLVVRRGDNEIEFRDFARWGEPLELGIARVLREELLARGATVSAAGVRVPEGDYDYEVTVRVLACEGTAGGEVIFRAVWEMAATGAGATVLATGETRTDNLRWNAKDEATLVAKLSMAVSGMGREIATAVMQAKR